MAGLGSLFIDLVARTGKFETDIGRAAREAERRSRQIQREFNQLGRRIGASLAAYFSVQTFQSIVRISDEYTQLAGRLSLVTENTQELASVQQSLFGIAQRTRTELSSVSDLYIKLAQTGEDLGASQEELLKFTEGVGNALIISGASAQQASGSLLQLSQALAGGTVRAQEFNSMLEGAPEIVRTVAANLEGMGGSVSELRRAVNEGRVSSQDFFKAFLQGADDLSSRAQSLPVTVGQAFTRLQNNINQAIAGADMSPIVDSINALSDLVTDPTFQQGFSSFISGIVRLASVAASTGAGFGVLGNEIAQFAARITGNMSELDKIEDRIEEVNRAIEGSWFTRPFRFFGQTRDELEETKRALEEQREAILEAWGIPSQKVLDEYNSKVKEVTVSVREFNSKAVDDALAAALKRQAEERAKALDSIQDLLDGLQQEIDTYGQGEAAVIAYRIAHGDLAETFAKAGAGAEGYAEKIVAATEKLVELRAETERQEAAQREWEAMMARGAAITEAVRTPLEIYQDTLAELNDLLDAGAVSQETYSRALKKAQEDLDEATNKWNVFKEQAARNTQDIIADTLINGFDRGVKGILKAFADMLLQMSAQAVAADIGAKIFGKAGGGEGEGLLGNVGGLIGSFFGGGRAIGGPVMEGMTYRINEREPEFFRPRVGGEIIPLSKMNVGRESVINNVSVTVQTPTGAIPMETQMQLSNRVLGAMELARMRNR